MKGDALDKLATQECDYKFKSGTTWPEEVFQLIQRILKCSAEKACGVVEKRALTLDMTVAEALLDSVEVQAIMTTGQIQEHRVDETGGHSRRGAR